MTLWSSLALPLIRLLRSLRSFFAAFLFPRARQLSATSALPAPVRLPRIDDVTPPVLPEEWKRSPAFYESKGIALSEGHWRNSQGFRLFTATWTPTRHKSKGLVFLCHGYGVNSSTFFRDTAEGVASGGYTVYGLDYQGFGQSEGLRGMIRSVDDIVDDCLAYFSPIRDSPESAGLIKVLCGESMGGAVALKLHLREPQAWDGAILMAPMCKIADDMKPHPVVEFVLRRLAAFAPTWAIVPTKDLADACNEDPQKREMCRKDPMIYHGKPRLGTAVALLAATEQLEAALDKVAIPLLILHGEADVVTDPNVSRTLFERACSKDKTFKLYPRMWHSLVAGAFDKDAAAVLQGIVSWLDERHSSDVHT